MHGGFGEIRIEVLERHIPLEVRGIITNITQGAIHVTVDEYLAAGPVRVWFSADCHSDGQIIFCRAIKNAYHAGVDFVPDPGQQRRSELRVPLTNQTAMVYQLEGSTDDKCNAQATDISRSGLGLLAVPGGGYRVGLRMETLLMRDGRTGLDAEILDRPLHCELESEHRVEDETKPSTC